MINKFVKLTKITSILLICFLAIGTSSAQDTLLDLVTDSQCESSCWLGIQIGITNDEAFQSILATNGIEYNEYPFGDDAKTYSMTNGFSNPLIENVAAISSSHVESINITLKNVVLDDVISLFGNPSGIFKNGQGVAMPYLAKGIIFFLNTGNDSILFVQLLDAQTLNQTFTPVPALDIFPTCYDETRLCQLSQELQIDTPILSSVSPSIETNPSFEWSAVIAVESYTLTVESNNTIIAQETFAPWDICDRSALKTCSTSISQSLPAGTYTATVQAFNQNTSSEMSEPITFTVIGN